MGPEERRILFLCTILLGAGRHGNRLVVLTIQGIQPAPKVRYVHFLRDHQYMNRFMICHRGALGDFILTWPALHALRKILPDLHFLGLGRREYMRLAVKLGLLDSSRDAEPSGMIDFFSGRSLPAELGAPKGAILWLSEGEIVADLLKKSASLPVVLIPPFPSGRIHVGLYHYLAVQSHFPIKAPYPSSLHFPLCVKRGEYALIHPGSGSPSKNYHLHFYLELAQILRELHYPDVRFILGPAEGEQTGRRLVGEKIDRPKDVETLAHVLAGASLYIGNDSGVSHLSGILGTPTIALYKTTDPEVWGVVGRRVINLQFRGEHSVLAKIKACLTHKIRISKFGFMQVPYAPSRI